MLKAQYEQRGPNPAEFIQAVESATPDPGEGQALVQVLAAPINPSDVLTLTGEYGSLPPLPAVGGNEGVGRVVAHGPGVGAPPIGQTVLLPVGCGTWATHVVADAKKLLPLPNEADPLQLAMMTVNPPTAKLMLSEFVDLQPGEWVIQNAANSGVGEYLVQIAKLRGLKTVNVVRREAAIEAVQAAGGDVVLVDGPGLIKRVAEATGAASIRLGIDAVGGEATNRLAGCLAVGGTLVNYGMMSGKDCVISPRNFVFKDVTLKGFWLAWWFRNAPFDKQMAVMGEIAKSIATGKLHTRVHATYDLPQIREAVMAAASGERNGKVLVVPRS
jgi:NADPH:quinone reductase-like Zn-dependent oxidoreductase